MIEPEKPQSDETGGHQYQDCSEESQVLFRSLFTSLEPHATHADAALGALRSFVFVIDARSSGREGLRNFCGQDRKSCDLREELRKKIEAETHLTDAAYAALHLSIAKHFQRWHAASPAREEELERLWSEAITSPEVLRTDRRSRLGGAGRGNGQ